MEGQEPARRKRARRITDEEDQELDEGEEEMSPDEEHRAVEESYRRSAEDHRAAMEAEEPKPGTLPPFPVDPVKGLNAGEPDR